MMAIMFYFFCLFERQGDKNRERSRENKHSHLLGHSPKVSGRSQELRPGLPHVWPGAWWRALGDVGYWDCKWLLNMLLLIIRKKFRLASHISIVTSNTRSRLYICRLPKKTSVSQEFYNFLHFPSDMQQ